MMKYILSQDIPAYVKTVTYFTADGGIMEIPIEARAVKLMKTDEEKRKDRRKYRKEYMSRPINQDKLKKRLADPDVIAKRKEYASREDVKIRKQQLAARNRSVRQLLKEKEPDLYRQLVGEAAIVEEQK